jgi:replication fork clamp-binding protein CrfC
MKKLKQDLEALSKNLKALALKSEKIVKVLDKLEKVPTELKTKAKSAGKTAVNKAKLTATEQVINIINKAKDGIDVAALKVKTGFEDRKIRNILTKAFKEGKIKRAGRGTYVG